jgi:hypothetical protein
VQGGLGRAGEQGRGSAGVWGATPARRGVAPVDGEAWLRSAASVGERGERERESSGREREGEAWPFIERERERVPGGEGGRPTINGAIRERTWGRREREGRGGFRLRRRMGAGRGVDRACGTRERVAATARGRR